MVMMVSASTATVPIGFPMGLPECIDQQPHQQHNPHPVPHTQAMCAMPAQVSDAALHGEPLLRQQVVDTQAEGDGADDDSYEVECQRPSSEHLADDEHRGGVHSRTGHQQHQRSPGRQTLGHQRHRNRYRARGANIHRYSHRQHNQHI